MTDETPQPVPDAEIPAVPPTPVREGFGRVTRRWARRGLALFVAVFAGLLFTILSVDLLHLWPGLRGLAERQATKYFERPAHIGRITALLTAGDFAIEDFVIEGRHPGDRPFMRVDRISLHLNWWPILRNLRHPQIHVEVRLTGWDMTVESWPGGIHNIPKLTPKGPASTKPKPFTTTVDFAYATGGHFLYEDHGTPWRVDAPDLNFSLVRSEALKQYVGHAQFSGGFVTILGYRPMATEMSTRFILDGPKVGLQHIDLKTDGSVSHVSGAVDFGRWPEQIYHVNSALDFKTMREIFFPNEKWRLAGEGQFTGEFNYAKDGARQLAGEFSSESAGFNDLDFGHLHGGLEWTNTRFAVSHADSDLLGGHTRFDYELAPLGTPNPATAVFDTDYTDLDLANLDRLIDLKGLKLVGQTSGRLSLAWQNGHFAATRRGEGHTTVAAPAGAVLAGADLPAVPLYAAEPFDSNRRMGPLTIAADVHYQIDPGGTTFEPSWTVTPRTYVSYRGRMAGDGSSNFPFHVTSHDWQESDRVLAGIMTAISGQTGAIDVAGRGTFDGAMTGRFSAPRIAGHFTGEALRVWDVTWGKATADLVIEDKYVQISRSLVTGEPGSAIVADGRYALGFRNDDREEIRAKVTLKDWPLADLRHAFDLDDWPMEGTLGMVDLTLTGRYKTMFGTGRMRIDKGSAWKESFESAAGDLELEGTGLRISRIEMHKGTGIIYGAARIGWDRTYAFNADGQGIAVEKLDNFQLPKAPLSGQLKFEIAGAGDFDAPVYSFSGSIDDLYVGDEGVGPVAGQFTIKNNVMSIERLQAVSGRVQFLGSGTLAFDDQYTSDLHLTFQETVLHPYLKFVMPSDVATYTRIEVGGFMSVKGPLSDPDTLVVDTTIDDATLTFFDYDLKNDGPVHLHLENGGLRIASPGDPAANLPATLTLKGRDTNLILKGAADIRHRTLDMSASGDASLSILQLFPSFETTTVAGTAKLSATLAGSFDAPSLTGEATLADGRLRPPGARHSLEAMNGRLVITPKDIELDGFRGRIGNGDVEFAGNIGLEGFSISEFNLRAEGRSMHVRYPEGFDSTVDMNLVLGGSVSAPRLSGAIDVVRVRLQPQSQSSLFSFCGFDAGALAPAAEGDVGLTPPTTSASPIGLDLRVTAPRMAFVDTKDARVEATANLQVLGTFDAPVINGEIGIVGGEVQCNGNRYFVRAGSIDFGNTDRFEPVFDLAAETRSRLRGSTDSGTTYTIDVQIGGRLTATRPELTFKVQSEPPLPETDLVSLIMGGSVDPGTAETRALGSAQAQQEHMIQSAGATILASPLTAFVGSVVERTGALDTVQITPVLVGESLQQLNPTARITLGKRISQRVFLTYSRTLNGPQEEIILLEYEQSDRVSWVLSRNEDRTFSLDFRIRYAF